MAEQKTWMQNIDKISYASAAVIGLLVLALPFLTGGQLQSDAAELESLRTELDEKLRTQTVTPPPETTPATRTLEEQWQVPTYGSGPAWVTHRPKILIRKQKEVEPTPAVHVAGCIRAIEFHRDTEKKAPFLRVRGEMSPENLHIEITRIDLYRRVDDGDPVKVQELGATGDFTYDDYEIESGRTYSYSFVSHAASVDPDRHALVRTEAAVPEVGPTLPVPYDVHVSYSIILGGELEPSFTGTAEYFDYDAGEYKKLARKSFKVSDKIDPAGRWTVRRVLSAGQGIGSQGRVVLKDSVDPIRNSTKKLTLTAGMSRTVEGWEPLAGNCDRANAATDEQGAPTENAAADASATSAEDDAAAGASATAAEDDATPVRPGGRRGF